MLKAHRCGFKTKSQTASNRFVLGVFQLRIITGISVSRVESAMISLARLSIASHREISKTASIEENKRDKVDVQRPHKQRAIVENASDKYFAENLEEN